MEFIEAPIFTQLIHQYLSDDEFRTLQFHLANDPEAGDLVPGTGGFRKVRWPDPRRRKGKRGGLRVIYYYFVDETQIWLMTIYGKDEADDRRRWRSGFSRRRSMRRSSSAPTDADGGDGSDANQHEARTQAEPLR